MTKDEKILATIGPFMLSLADVLQSVNETSSPDCRKLAIKILARMQAFTETTIA